MPRLPVPGSDDGVWGGILNEYLEHEHNADGTHKTVAVSKGGTGATAAAAARTNLGAAAAADLTAHANDTTAIHGIADTSVLETTSGSQAKVDTHVNDTSAAHAATAVSFAPTGTISGTTVQAAIEEVATESGASITLSDLDPAATAAAAAPGTSAEVSRHDHVHPQTGLATDTELTNHANDTTAIHGIADTSVLETTSGAQAKVDAHAGAADPHTTYLNNTRHDALDHTAALASAALADLGDVAATAPADGQVLTFDTTNGWQPEAIPAHDHDATYVNETDHTKAAHDALLIDAATLDGVDSTGFATSSHNHDANYASLAKIIALSGE